MSTKHSAFIAGAILLLPVMAHAETSTGGESSPLVTFIWGVLPFIVFFAAMYWFLRKMQGKRMKKYDEHVARTVQHFERVEQSLERIAKLLEKKD